MIVQYNGVRLEMAEIQSIRREAVYDDTHTHLLYIRWNIGVIALYNPNGYPVSTSVTKLRPGNADGRAANAGRANRSRNRLHPLEYILPAASAIVDGVANYRARLAAAITKILKGKDAKPTEVFQRQSTTAAFAGTNFAAGAEGTFGYGPILTDVTLRNRLMTPQRPLTISGYDIKTATEVPLIQSPKIGDAVDPTNGPHPIALDILDGSDNGFMVFFQIETTTLPCEDQSDRLVLSHVWEMSHTHDDNQYLTRVIEGELILNGAMVHTFGVYADQFRSQFFHPIPLGCERKIPFIQPSSDGLSYKYRIEDTDQTIVFDAGDTGATHMNIVEKVVYNQPWRILGAAKGV